ncbi:MAG TPA: hypothetical protein VGC75_02440 [Candidatus Nitrosocosmicus sp.]|jgi:hypothetical protein
MGKIIYPIAHLFEELEEKIQRVTKDCIYSLSNYTDIQSLNTQDEIKEYVNEVIKEITDFKEEKRRNCINNKDLDKIQKDDNNNNL